MDFYYTHISVIFIFSNLCNKSQAQFSNCVTLFDISLSAVKRLKGQIVSKVPAYCISFKLLI